MDELGLLTALIPELEALRGVEQPKEHTWDVLNHSLKSMASLDFVLRQAEWPFAAGDVLNDIPWSNEISEYFAGKVNGVSMAALTRMAALLHDIAKPQTRIITEDGRLRFFGHADQGTSLAESILKQLRFSRKQTELVAAMVGGHLRPVQMGRPGEMPSEKAVYRYFRNLGQAAIATLYLSLADHLATRGPDLEAKFWQHHAGVVKFAINQHNMQQQRVAPPKIISGDDIIEHLGLKPGPAVGQLLEAVQEAQAAGEVTNRKEALALAAEVWESQKHG
jgi:poly(A) polymerase